MDGNFLLVTTSSLSTPFIGLHPTQDILIFDINDITTFEACQKLTGLKQSRYVVRADFGGPQAQFVVSGSEGPTKLALDGLNLTASLQIQWYTCGTERQGS